MNYSNIKYCDIANGSGVRTTIFVSGCRNHCEGCFQPETWDFNNGKKYTQEVEDKIIQSCRFSYINGLTLLGGDPFEEENQAELVKLTRRFKETYPDKTIWAFTGYIYDDLLQGGKKHTQYTDELLSYIDVLVDGPFILDKKDLLLGFRGSSNQRVIDVQKTIQGGNKCVMQIE